MPKDDHCIQVIREWLEKAENDLLCGTHVLKLRDNCPADTVCFHAQQCAEKYLKALLILHNIPVLRTHNLSELFKMLPEPRPEVHNEDLLTLTRYAVDSRYPDDPHKVTVPQAREATAAAKRVRREIRRLLPLAAKRKRK